jgi:hypothetical protein
VCFSSRCSDGSLTETLFHCSDNNLTSVGLALGNTICFGSLEFTADHLGCLSLPPLEWDSGAIFVGTVHNGSPSLCTTLEESFDEDGVASGVGGSIGRPTP